MVCRQHSNLLLFFFLFISSLMHALLNLSYINFCSYFFNCYLIFLMNCFKNNSSFTTVLINYGLNFVMFFNLHCTEYSQFHNLSYELVVIEFCNFFILFIWCYPSIRTWFMSFAY